MRRTGKVLLVPVLVCLSTLGFVSPAAANHVGCGQVVTQNTKLDRDVGPCAAGGIVVGADNVTLDLNGHRVFGTRTPGDGAGIFLQGRTRVTVKNGTVSDFDGGVVIEGGTANTVTGMLARDNIGRSEGHPPAPSTRYGEGIAVEGSTDNRIVRNTAINNGPFAGIGLYEVPDTDHPFQPGPTSGNRVERNVVEDNVACREGPFCDNDGIRLEPQVGPGNVVSRNVVRRNGLDGISLFGRASENEVSRNLVEANGFRGAVPGDGIRVFGFSNLVERNDSFRNANDGISVGRRSIAPPGSFPPPNGRSNRIVRNNTGGNGAFDLWDSNIDPPCDANFWFRNTFRTAEPPCTRAQ